MFKVLNFGNLRLQILLFANLWLCFLRAGPEGGKDRNLPQGKNLLILFFPLCLLLLFLLLLYCCCTF